MAANASSFKPVTSLWEIDEINSLSFDGGRESSLLVELSCSL
jgi:hypothetical protein